MSLLLSLHQYEDDAVNASRGNSLDDGTAPFWSRLTLELVTHTPTATTNLSHPTKFKRRYNHAFFLL